MAPHHGSAVPKPPAPTDFYSFKSPEEILATLRINSSVPKVDASSSKPSVQEGSELIATKVPPLTRSSYCAPSCPALPGGQLPIPSRTGRAPVFRQQDGCHVGCPALVSGYPAPVAGVQDDLHNCSADSAPAKVFDDQGHVPKPAFWARALAFTPLVAAVTSVANVAFVPYRTARAWFSAKLATKGRRGLSTHDCKLFYSHGAPHLWRAQVGSAVADGPSKTFALLSAYAQQARAELTAGDAGLCWTALFPPQHLPNLIPILGRNPRLGDIKSALQLLALPQPDPEYTNVDGTLHVVGPTRMSANASMFSLEPDMPVGSAPFSLGPDHMCFPDAATGQVWFADARQLSVRISRDHPTLLDPSGAPRRFSVEQCVAVVPGLALNSWSRGPYPNVSIPPPPAATRPVASFSGLLQDGWALDVSGVQPLLRGATRSVALYGVEGPTDRAAWSVAADARVITYTGTNYPLASSPLEIFRISPSVPSPEDLVLTVTTLPPRTAPGHISGVTFSVRRGGVFVANSNGIRNRDVFRYSDGSIVPASDLIPPVDTLAHHGGPYRLPRPFTAGLDEDLIARFPT